MKGELAAGHLTGIVYRYGNGSGTSFDIVLDRGNCR